MQYDALNSDMIGMGQRRREAGQRADEPAPMAVKTAYFQCFADNSTYSHLIPALIPSCRQLRGHKWKGVSRYSTYLQLFAHANKVQSPAAAAPKRRYGGPRRQESKVQSREGGPA